MTTMPLGGGEIDAVASPCTPVGVVAVIVTLPRGPLGRRVPTSPDAVTDATVVFELVHSRGTVATVLPAASNACAVIVAVEVLSRGTFAGLSTSRVVLAPGPT